MFKTKPQRPPPIPPVKKEGKESEPRHHIISYYDPTGVWGLVAAGIQARLPIKEARWKTNAVIRKLNLDIVNFDGKAPLPSSQHVSNLYNAPFVNIMILNGDTGSPNFSKKKSYQYVKDWLDKIQSSQWIVVLVQTVAQQNGIFNVSFFDKIRLEFPLYKNRFCLIKFYEGQNLEQWNDLSDKIRDCFIASFDKVITQLTTEVDRLDGSKFSSPWSFLPYYQVKECLAITYEKANLLDQAINQYIELEDAFKRHTMVEQKNGAKDRCFSAYFSCGSDAKLIISKDYDTYIGQHFQEIKRKLGTGRISKFDFHQYVVSKIIRLYFAQGMYEHGLKKATSFINESYKAMTSNKDISPIFVQAWVYSASFSVANFCTEKILREAAKSLSQKDSDKDLKHSSSASPDLTSSPAPDTSSFEELSENKEVLKSILEDPQKKNVFVLISNLLFIAKRQLKRLGYLRKLVSTHIFYEELREVSRITGIDLDGRSPVMSNIVYAFSDYEESVSDVPAVSLCGGNDTDYEDIEIPIPVATPSRKDSQTPSEQAVSEFYDEKLTAPGSTSVSPSIRPHEDIEENEPEQKVVEGKQNEEQKVVEVKPSEEVSEKKVAEEKQIEEQKVVEEKTAEQKPSEEKPTEEKAVEEKPVEEKPVEQKAVEENPADEKPTEEKVSEQKTAEEKPVEDKPAEVKSRDDKLSDDENQGSEVSEAPKANDEEAHNGEETPRRGRISLDVPREDLSIKISTEEPKQVARNMTLKQPPKLMGGRPLSYMQSMDESKIVFSPMASPRIVCESVSPELSPKASPDPSRTKKQTKRSHKRTKTGGGLISIPSNGKKHDPSEFVTNFYQDDFVERDMNGKNIFSENIEDFERNVNDESLMKSLRTEEEFDKLFETITKKSELTFSLARRNRSTISIMCELAFHNFLRGNWEQAENGLNSVLDSLIDEGWSQLACSMLVFLAYVQNKREEYSDYISTCLRLLSYENFDRKFEFSSALIDVASNKLPEMITKEINDDNLSLTIKYPEDIESKEYHIGDDISLVCTLTNNLPIEFSIQSIEVVFSTADGSKSFTMRNDEGSSVDVVARGTNSDFVVRTVTGFHGVYKFASFSFVIGNLKLVYNSKNEPSENEKDKLITIVPVMPTAEIIAKFPKWLPKDINNPTYDVMIKLLTNDDHITHGSFSFTPESTLFSVDKKDEPCIDIEGARGYMTTKQSIEFPSQIPPHKEIFVKVPINVFNKKDSLQTELDFSFQTKLNGGISHIKKDWEINFSEPFTMQYHQVPFRHDSIIVQIMLKSISNITLSIKSFKIAPKDRAASQFTGSIKKLTSVRTNTLMSSSCSGGGSLMKNSSSVSLRSSGRSFGGAQENIVVLPESEIGIAYIFKNPPQLTEEWNFTLEYEFAPWDASEVVRRTFSSKFHMGLSNPEFIVTLSFPKNVIVGNIFDIKVSVSVNTAVGVKLSPEVLKRMKLKVTPCDPRQLIIQGFSSRIVDLSPLIGYAGTDDKAQQKKCSKMEFVFRVITLHTGEIFVPRVELIDSTESNKARVLSEHPVILSLSDTHYVLSSEKVVDGGDVTSENSEKAKKELSNNSEKMGIVISDIVSQRTQYVMNVIWVHSNGSTLVASSRCTQRMESVKARLATERKIKMTMMYSTYDRWIATRNNKMLGPEKLKNIKLIVDERDRIASRVLLFVRQEPSLVEIPIIIFCEDKNKNWTEFLHLNNVFVANTLQDIEDILTYDASSYGFTSRGCNSIDSVSPPPLHSHGSSSSLATLLTRSSGIVLSPSRFHLPRSQKK